jgi:hypothetical protein
MQSHAPTDPKNTLHCKDPRQKRLSRFLFPACLACALVLPCTSAERGQLDFSPSLFTVMAAINAAGYDAEAASPNADPLRAQIRKAVEASHAPVIAELKMFFAEHRLKDETAELGQYVSFALSVKGPPGFRFQIPRRRAAAAAAQFPRQPADPDAFVTSLASALRHGGCGARLPVSVSPRREISRGRDAACVHTAGASAVSSQASRGIGLDGPPNGEWPP